MARVHTLAVTCITTLLRWLYIRGAVFEHVVYLDHPFIVSHLRLLHAQVFLKYADFFKMYTEYLNGYEECLSVTSEVSRKDGRFRQFTDTVSQKLTENKGLNLNSYLIMPVQRVPRYVLLLEELRKHTDPKSSEYRQMDEALEKIKTIATKINSNKRKMENMTKLVAIQSRISNFDGLCIHLLSYPPPP